MVFGSLDRDLNSTHGKHHKMVAHNHPPIKEIDAEKFGQLVVMLTSGICCDGGRFDLGSMIPAPSVTIFPSSH